MLRAPLRKLRVEYAMVCILKLAWMMKSVCFFEQMLKGEGACDKLFA